MLPGWSRFAEQLDVGIAQFLDGCGQVADGEPDDRSAVKVLPARVERAEDFDVPAVRQFEDLQARLAVHVPQAQHVLVEVC